MDEKKESDYESDYESDNGENEIMNMMRAMIYLVPLTAVFFVIYWNFKAFIILIPIFLNWVSI